MKKVMAILLFLLVLSVSALAETMDMPGIGGSQAYDVIISLKDMGVDQPETKNIDGGFQWTSDVVHMGNVDIMYDITANKNHEICTAIFNMSGGDNGFLTWVGTLPYDEADKEKAQAFISEHLTGEDSTLTIGDAVWEIYPYETGGAMLRVHDVESEDYFNAQLDALLGL